LHNRGPQYATHPNYITPNPDYVILCVDLPFNRNRLGCVLLLDGNKNDQQFFIDLKRSYHKLRCWHRLYVFLTFKTLSHFKFVRVGDRITMPLLIKSHQKKPRCASF
jgi:hypothetical protein